MRELCGLKFELITDEEDEKSRVFMWQANAWGIFVKVERRTRDTPNEWGAHDYDVARASLVDIVPRHPRSLFTTPESLNIDAAILVGQCLQWLEFNRGLRICTNCSGEGTFSNGRKCPKCRFGIIERGEA